jgi:hypothetical protein
VRLVDHGALEFAGAGADDIGAHEARPTAHHVHLESNGNGVRATVMV